MCIRDRDKSGYIIADESTRTSLPGVFAVGDVRTKALRQVVTAVSDLSLIHILKTGRTKSAHLK